MTSEQSRAEQSRAEQSRAEQTSKQMGYVSPSWPGAGVQLKFLVTLLGPSSTIGVILAPVGRPELDATWMTL